MSIMLCLLGSLDSLITAPLSIVCLCEQRGALGGCEGAQCGCDSGCGLLEFLARKDVADVAGPGGVPQMPAIALPYLEGISVGSPRVGGHGVRASCLSVCLTSTSGM